MSVDDLRDTFHINIIHSSQIGFFLSAQSYRPEITHAVKEIKAWGQWKTLGEITTQIAQGRTPDYAASGYPCLKTRNVNGLIVDKQEVAYVNTETVNPMNAFFIDDENLLLNRSGVGSIGRIGIYFGNERPLVNEHVFKIVITPPVDPAFVCCFLSTWWGERAIEQGVSGSTGQLNLAGEHIRSLPIILPDEKAQAYIGNKVRQAERLRERAQSIESNIRREFDFLTHDLLPQRKSWRSNSTLLDCYRINSKHYDASVLDMLEKAKRKIRLVELKNLIGKRGISGGATPKGASYPASGVFFVRVQNVKPLRLDLSDAAFIDELQDRELSRSRCFAGEVILTITGYPGVAAVVLVDDLPVNINQHSVRFDVSPDWFPEYVAAAINTEFVKKQVDRLAIGGTRDALDYLSVKRLLIPKLESERMGEIANQVRFSNYATRYSSTLTQAAKLLVEALIERKVSEEELKQAQEGLERGDDSLDRAILTRLTRKGSDAAKEPSLFADLDALYDALAQASTADQEKERP